jgi:hypothetical protein
VRSQLEAGGIREERERERDRLGYRREQDPGSRYYSCSGVSFIVISTPVLLLRYFNMFITKYNK